MTQFLPNYRHIVNPKLKNIYLHIDKNGDLVIKSPKVSVDRIEKLLISKSAWIKRARERILSKKGDPEFKNDGIKILYLGKKIDVILKESNMDKLDFIDTDFVLLYTSESRDRLQKTIDKFYLVRAKLTLPSIVEKWSKIMCLEPAKLRFRKTKTQWGSCSSKNEISLNTALMKLPPHLVDYIIIHELCHIRHKHHQKSFWEEVGRYCPDFKACRTTLKEYSV